MIEMIVLVAASIVFRVLAGWLTRAVFFGRLYQWPRGYHKHMSYQGYHVHMITSQGIAPDIELLTACTRAVAAAGHAWTLSGNPGARGKLGEVAIRFVPDSAFEEHPIETLRRSAAYLDAVPRRFGRHMPCAVVRASLMTHVLESGDPVIHEMLCVLDDWDIGRPGPDIWELSPSTLPIQKQALECFANAGQWHIQY